MTKARQLAALLQGDNTFEGNQTFTGDVGAKSVSAVEGLSVTGKTLSLGGNFTHTGAHTLGLTTTANTSVTLPTSGTLATTDQIPTVDVTAAGANTFTGINTFSTQIRVPTSLPASLDNGAIWIAAIT